ncbi:ABC transporter substrate-binding protein [Gordonia hankookensis]|uniref:ABC transporter substrate-binding protein n=1 Tax=Gordonia hankookensis TaxID=589403 RepID=A0ABR7W969_9ACTN|nr:ABC transporter substrate-binding protein [Gordonia hankookensis]MBD1319355.1 ABC transporter substrate-binding protein [Gordonia hankookensis]
MKSSTKRWSLLPCVALAVVLVAAGCSGDDAGSPSGSTPDESALGAPKQAAGDPVNVVFQTTGEKGVTYTQEKKVADATVSYINDYLGGINGRPLAITVCEDQAQVSLARECANKAVASDAVAVISGDPSNPDTTTAVTSKAGMLFMDSSGGGQPTLSSPNTAVLSNSLAGLVGVPAAYAKEKGIKKVAILTIDAPIATGPIKLIGPMAFGNAGVAMDLIPVPMGTPDMTPQIQAALKNGDGMFHVLGNDSFCATAFKAMRTLNTDAPVTTVSQCIGNSDVASQIPGGYEGIKVVQSRSLDPNAAETKVFEAVLAKYDAQGAEDGAAAYLSLVAFQRALEGMSGDIDRTSVAARVTGMPESRLLPLNAGAKYQCGSKMIAIAPNICTNDSLLGTAQKDGTVVDVEPIDVAPLFQRPGA